MPITTEDFHSSLYDLLRTKGYEPIPLDSKGKTSPFYPEADIFKFSFVKDGKKYGDVWATVDNALKLVLYYDDEVSSSPTGDTAGAQVGDSWPSLLRHLKRWAQRRQLGFELKNKDHLVSDMQQREFMKKKERLGEGYHPMGKKASYNDAIPQVKIVIQHSKQLGEGEQRFRNVEKIFVENTEGERFAVPTKKPGLAKIYARHVAEGGTPYDERGRHLTTLIEEYSKMVGFMRATKSGEFTEAVQRVVEAGRDHFAMLRETLHKLISNRGYHNYFESWSPVLNEEQTDTGIATLFTKQQLDPRIESCIPILSKVAKLDETKPVKELDAWADEVISETTGLPVEMPSHKSPSYRDKKKIRDHLKGELEAHKAEQGKKAALSHYQNQLKHGDEGVTEGYHNNVMHAWNSGMSDEEIIQRFGKSEFDRLKKKYGDGSIPVQDLLGLKSKEPEDKRVRLHRGLEGPGKALKSIIKQQNQKQGVAEGSADMEWHGSNTDMKWYDAYKDQPVRVKVKNHSGLGSNPSGTFKIRSFKKIGPSKAELTIISRGEEMTGTVDLDNPETVVNKMYDKVPAMKFYIGSMPATARQAFNLFQYKNKKQGVTEGYILKKTKVEKTFTPGDPDEYYTSGGADVTTKDTDYEIINNKTGQVVGTASWTTNDYFGPGALKITMKNGATRWIDIWEREKGNPQSAFNRFVKDPKTAKKYKEQGVTEGDVIQGPWGRKPTLKPEVGGTGTSTADQEPTGLRQVLQDKYSRFDNITITWQSKDQMAQEVEWEEGEGFPPNLIGEFEVKFEEDSDEGYTMEVTDTWSVKSKNFNGRAPYELKRTARISAEMESLDPQQKKAGQLGPTEKAKNISPVLGSPQHEHPFDGKLVGASESADLELKRLKSLIDK